MQALCDDKHGEHREPLLASLLCNRQSDGRFTPPADGWYHLVPTGIFPLPADHPHPAAPEATSTSSSASPSSASSVCHAISFQVIDARALDSMQRHFDAEAAHPRFAGLLIDFDHFSYDPDKSSEAAGWLHALQNRADGLWGRIKWSDLGEDAIQNGRYRFVSPTWLLRDTEEIADCQLPISELPNSSEGFSPMKSGPSNRQSPIGNRKYLRPLRLDTLALTNSPNLRGMAPLSNRDGLPNGGRPPAPHGGLAPDAPSVINPSPVTPASPTKHTPPKRMKTIATTFGLSPDASEEAIHAEVTKLLSQARQSTEALTPLKNRVSELEASNAHLLAAQVESDLDLHQKRFPAAQRDAWKKQLLANRTATLELLSGLPEAAAQSTIGNRKSEMSPRIHNRETAVDPGSRLAAQSDAGTLLSVGCSSAQAAAIRNRATELRSADKSLSYSQAFDRARRELATR